MNNSNDEFPKTPPFVFRDSNDQTAGKPDARPDPRSRINGLSVHPSNKGMMSVAVFLISSLSMGIGLMGGGWIGLGVLLNGINNFPALFAGLLAAGLAYGVGWVIGLFGVRLLRNKMLPVAMKAYAWIILMGLAFLQISIISRLFGQEYQLVNFFKYVILFVAGLIALIGVHLIVENHDLVPFSFPILIISLIHLYFIVYQYIIIASLHPIQFCYSCVFGDTVFFILTASMGALMLVHMGLLSKIRTAIDKFFKEKASSFVPPD